MTLQEDIERAKQYAAEESPHMPSDGTRSAVAYMSGAFDARRERNPLETFTTFEISEMLNALFDIPRSKTPAAGTAGESE